MPRHALARLSLIAPLLALLSAASPAQAEDQISLYSGWQGVGDAAMTVRRHPDLGDGRYPLRWQGKPLSAPPYWGLRWTHWAADGPGFGWGLEFTHTKAYARDPAALGFSHLEMSDGLNTATVNALWRWAPGAAGLRPYVGGGLGVSIPHFEATSASDVTTGYQLAGPALRALAGVEMALTDRWGGFVEAQATWSRNRVDFDSHGRAEVDLTTTAINLGLSYRF